MAGGFEGENPTRRYKWFRPRQAARGYINLDGATNNVVCGLFNNSSTFYLVVRDVMLVPAVAGYRNDGLYYVQGNPGTVGGTIVPMVPGMGAPAGQLFSWDTTTFPSPDLLLPYLTQGANGSQHWLHDFPLAVLQAGWSLASSNINGSKSMQLYVMWEAIYPEELDWYF